MYSKKQNSYYRRKYKEDPERFREYNRRSYQKNKQNRDLRVKNYQKQSKVDVIAHYSNNTNKCKCCGIEGLVFLTIDHIFGDGALQRREKKHKTGTMFYMWLRSNGYPDGFQVLCHNCNQAKRQLANCPHKELLTNK